MSLKWVLLLSFSAAFFILVGDQRTTIGVMVLYAVLAGPQLYLIIQYENASTYKSFQIDHVDQVFIVNLKDQFIRKNFAELKTIQYHKAVIPGIYLSSLLNMCSNFYYYRLEFQDGEVYYLTSLLAPKPAFARKDFFYDHYFVVERTYASIRSEKPKFIAMP